MREMDESGQFGRLILTAKAHITYAVNTDVAVVIDWRDIFE